MYIYIYIVKKFSSHQFFTLHRLRALPVSLLASFIINYPLGISLSEENAQTSHIYSHHHPHPHSSPYTALWLIPSRLVKSWYFHPLLSPHRKACENVWANGSAIRQSVSCLFFNKMSLTKCRFSIQCYFMLNISGGNIYIVLVYRRKFWFYCIKHIFVNIYNSIFLCIRFDIY